MSVSEVPKLEVADGDKFVIYDEICTVTKESRPMAGAVYIHRISGGVPDEEQKIFALEKPNGQTIHATEEFLQQCKVYVELGPERLEDLSYLPEEAGEFLVREGFDTEGSQSLIDASIGATLGEVLKNTHGDPRVIGLAVRTALRTLFTETKVG